MSALRAGSHLRQTIGDTEKVTRLGSESLSKAHVFNSKLIDGASVGPGFTIQKIPLGFAIQDHFLDVLDVAKVLDKRWRV